MVLVILPYYSSYSYSFKRLILVIFDVEDKVIRESKVLPSIPIASIASIAINVSAPIANGNISEINLFIEL